MRPIVPEQARGRAVDKRTDVWAFGAVLYEMLTGARTFDGEDVTEIMASVVKTTPNWTALPADTPPNIITLIHRCLDKDRNARIGDMAVVRFLLAGYATAGASPAVTTPAAIVAAPRSRQTIPWVLAAVVAGTLVGWLLPRRPTVASPVTHVQMGVLPADQLVGSIASVRPARTAMAMSPDGRTVVFAATRGPATQLFLRGLDRIDATPLAGTEGASGPFYSPDGAWIGFWVGNTIKKVPVAGGPPAAIADVPARAGSGASWSEDGTIFFEGDTTGISKVSSAGGPATTIIPPDGSTGERHLLPHVLPGGNALLVTSLKSGDWETATIVSHSLVTGERRVLIPGGADGRYVNTGHLLYMKAGTLMAVAFDARSLQVTGAPVALIEGVMQGVNAPNSADETGAGQFTVSASGTLLYVVGGISPIVERSLVWVDRTGGAQPMAATTPAAYFGPRLSPDGQKLAVSVRRGASRSADVWISDVVRGAPTRLTFDGGFLPVWSPDGKRLVYGAATAGTTNLHVIDAAGGGKPVRLAPSDFAQLPSSWAPGTNVVAFLQRPRSGAFGIWVLPMEGEPKPRLFLESRFRLWHPTLSSDGRWMAYVSSESGANEVYVQPYWDVSADGQRFLLQRPIASTDKPVTTLHVVLNWTDELKRLVAVKSAR